MELALTLEKPEALAGFSPAIGSASFGCVYADPPWEYPEGFPTQTTVNGEWQPVEIKPLPYPSMTVPEICALPVNRLAAKDCRLFLWTTNRYLRAAFDVLDAWGFEYRQTLTWHKLDGNTGGSIAPNSTEFLMVAVKGKPACKQRLKTSVVGMAHQRHSQKPKEFYYLIERTTEGPYVELFARRKRPGWQSWGNEVASDVTMTPNSDYANRPG